MFAMRPGVFLSADAEMSSIDEKNDQSETKNSHENDTEPTDNAEFAQIKKEMEDAKTKLAETHDKMLRIAADFENARKRWDREREEVRSYCISEFARDLLPVIDAFDKAVSAVEEAHINFETEDGKKMAAVVEGIKIVAKTFSESTKKHGVEKLPGKGEPFDPKFHNAVARIVDGAVKQDTVIEEFMPGYKIGDRILRTAMVRVATPD